MDRGKMLEPICDDWRARIEAAALRLSTEDRARLIERLVLSHERYYEILASWRPELERQMEEIRAGRVEFIPLEDVLAELEAIDDEGTENLDPRIPETFEEIRDEALHLPHGDFHLLLTRLEATLSEAVDPVWRADIQRRIAAIPAELERRYLEANGGWHDDEDDEQDAAVR